MSRIISLALLLCTLAVSCHHVQASHFAYGTISWSLTATPAYVNRHTVNFESAWRRDYPTFTPYNPSAGQTFTSSDIGTLTVSQTQNSGPCCGKPSYDYCYIQYSSMPGRGCGIWTTNLAINILVSVTYPDDWLSGQTSVVYDPPDQAQIYSLVYTMCCRIGTLTYSAGSSTRLSAQVGTAHTYSPRSTSFPRQYIIVGEAANWQVPSIHPLGWAMTYSLSSTSESALTASYPSGYGSAFSLDSNTGKITWTPTVLGLFAIQFKMTSYNPANSGQGASFVVLDTIFQVVTQCTSSTPGCSHPPVFDPALPATTNFYQGSAGTFTVTARSDDADTVQILTSPLPPGASFTYVSATKGTNTAGKPATWTTYQLLWAPTLASVPATVCFTARAQTSGTQSAGSNCVNLVFGTGGIIFVSGILRDFHSSSAYPTYLTDFNHADGDLGVNFVSSTLGANNLPVWTGGAGTTNSGNFGWWYNTDANKQVNLPQVYDMVFNNATTNKGNVFSWNPGTSWWPLDNQLFGNEADAHNRYFTLEIHTYITYRGGEILVMQSSDDLFVYIDKQLPPNWNMGGIIASQTRTYSISMDTIKNPSTDKDKTFQVDIFYAHRSSTGPPQIKLSLMSATLCNSLDSGLTLISLSDFSAGSSWVSLVGSAGFSSNMLQLMQKGPSLASAAWFSGGSGGGAVPYKIAHGFSATFNFKWDGITEGFAFVLQFDNGAAQGGQTSQLGYGGLAGIKNSIAIEFDGVSTTALGDPAWQHVSIHSRYTAANDANELSRVSGSVYSGSDFNFRFDNGTMYNVRVEYIPAIDNGQGGPQYGWIRVYMGQAGGVQQVGPITSAQVDGVLLESMWHGTAYVGFTAATSDTNAANIYIQNFNLVVVPGSAAKSLATVRPGTIAAGTTGSMKIQLKDACGNTITNGGDCAAFTSIVRRSGVTIQTPTCANGGMVDNADGTYTIYYSPTVTNDPSTPYEIAVSYTNPGASAVAVSGSPFQFTVLPGQTDPTQSTFAVTYNYVAANGKPASGALGSGSVGTVTITARDTYGNLQTVNTDPFVISFDPDIVAGGGQLVQATKTGTSTYTGTFATPQSSTFQLYVRLQSTNLPTSPQSVTFVAGPASAAQSSASGNGLASGNVGQSSSFTLTLRDSAGNGILQVNPTDVTCLNVADGCVLVPVTTPPTGYTSALQQGLPTPVNVPITCVWAGQTLTCSYTTNIAYTYTVTMLINKVAMASLSTAQVVIAPGAIAPAKCIAQMPSASQAGVSQSMLIQARDQYSNTVPSPAAQAFVVTFTPNLLSPAGNPIYSAYGLYSLSFVPSVAGTNAYSIALSLSGTSIAGSPYNLAVIAGTPDQKSQVTTANPVSATITAAVGTPNMFKIESHDVYDNIRTQGGAATDYLVTLTNTATTQVLDSIASIAATTNQFYTVNWGTIYAGSYTLHAKVRSQSGDIVRGAVSVTVNPDITATAHCLVSGAGTQGGVIGTSVSISVTAADQFDNVQSLSVTDTFRAVVTSGDAGSPKTYTFTRDGTSGLYSASYPVPANGITAGTSTYTVAVQRSVSGSFADLPGSPFTAVLSSASGSLYTTLEQATSAQVNKANTFYVVERSGVTGATKAGGMFLSVDIYSADTTAGSPTIRVPNVGIATATASTFNYTVTFNPQFAFPKGNSNFFINVSRNGVTSMLPQSATSPVISASPYAIALLAGPVYGPNCAITGLPNTITAGGSGTFSVALKDLFGNAINYAVTGTFTATLTPLAVVSPPITPISITGTVTGATVSFPYTASRASIYNVVISYASQTLGSAATIAQITVNPDVPSAVTSLVQPNAASPLPASKWLFDQGLTAGVADKFSVVVKDKYSNAIDPTLLAGGVINPYLSFSLNDGGTAGKAAVFGTPSYTGGSGAFDITILSFVSNPTASATWTLTVSINGTALSPAPLVRVNNAAIDGTKTTASNVPNIVVAGTSPVFILNAQDIYGNAWYSGKISAAARDFIGSSSPAVVSAWSTVPGRFNVSLAADYTTRAGNYTFEIRANGVLFLATNPLINVIAGAVDASKTDVPPFLPAALAGDTVSVALGLRDSYSNLILNPDAGTIASIQVNFPVDTGENSCNAASSDDTFYGYGFSNIQIVPNGQGATLTFVGTVVNNYNVNITIGSKSLDCTRLARLALTIRPGVGVAGNSVVSGLADVTAGRPVTLTITVFDKYNNQLDRGGSNVQIGSQYKDSSPWYPFSSDQSLWLKNTSVIQDFNNGVYTAILYPTKAATLQAVVTLDGYLIKTYGVNGTQTTKQVVDPLLVIAANVPATYQLVNVPTNITAATPFTLSLTVQDIYSNNIAVLSPRYNYTYSITAQTVNPTDYSFNGLLAFQTNGQYQWTATSALSGPATVYISLQQGINYICSGQNAAKPFLCSDFSCVASSDACKEAAAGKGSASITILPATCAAIDATKPYRCPPVGNQLVGDCSTDYASCPTLTGTLCPAATPVRCSSDSKCVASAELCVCPGTQKKCPSGVCVDDINTQCHTVAACPSGLIQCQSNGLPTGQCRASAADCPSNRVCTPGYVACPDGISCRRPGESCSNLLTPATCPIGTFRCSNGHCVGRVEDCPTPKTCASGQVLCLSDGSCAASAAACPDQYKCYAPTPFTCADGSCRTSASGCPSQVSCPVGWALCENGQCAKSLSACLSATKCPLNQVRCPTGACVANRMLCPSQMTCPEPSSGPRPVLCPDSSCQSAVAYCVNPRVCPTGSSVCPDGSCVSGNAQCPSTTTCPMTAPTLCADGVTCASDSSSCVAPTDCPVENPMRCPDGSCRSSLLDCPSRSACPAIRPVRCADGSCVYSNQQCTAIPTCPASEPIRCPGGDCVASTSLCPTHVTCPLGSSRCADGSCRTDCTNVQPINCAAGQISCPLASVGSLCVNTLDQCPSAFICPADRPVRCLDTSCAATVSACPPLPTADPEVSKTPCPDGSWTTDLSTCNTPASCPSSMPFKCWDETCRASPTDCTFPSPCTNSATPFRCPNGACASSPYSTDCRVTIQNFNCPQNQPVKCPSTYNCVASVNSCSASLAPGTVPSQTDSSTWASACPPQWARCRDGSCRMSNKTCDSTTCPTNLPFLCANGACAANLAGCPDPLTGCYAPLVGCATTGACVANADDPNQCPLPPSTCYLTCGDGLCVAEADLQNYNSICATHQCSLRCADHSCGLTAKATNISATTANNLCTQGGTQDSVNLPLKNVCPPNLPYKCADGLCAFSQLNCTASSNFGNCPADRPVQCANAQCVIDSTQCPPLYPCADGEMRCGDGSCRVRQPLDEGDDCTSWGIANTCPLFPGSNQPRFRCANGLCALGLTKDTCIDLSTGCPNGLITKCPSGACLSVPRWGGYNNTVDACLAIQPAQADGCASGTSKCSYGGQCVVNTQTDCPLFNGCLPSTPFRCTATGADSGACVADTGTCQPAPAGCYRCADGSCAPSNDAKQCNMLNGCPPAKPYRCADGSCARYGTSALLFGATLSQVCPPTVTCASGQVLCYDGSCAATSALCPSAVGCMSPMVLCADRTCVNDASMCATGVVGTNATASGSLTGTAALAICPPSVPVLCDNGQCVSAATSCPRSVSPGSGTGTGRGGLISQLNDALVVATGDASSATGCAPGLVQCKEGGSCATYATCQQRALDQNGPCNSDEVMCPIGTCMPDPGRNQSGIASCGVIAACGAGYFRCFDGTCVTDVTTCPLPTSDCQPVTFPGFQPVATQRCQDGQCRYVCPSYDGCPHTTAPYQCPNRECAVNAAACASAAVGAGFDFHKVRPYLSAPLIKSLPSSIRRLMQSSSSTGDAGSDSSSSTGSDPSAASSSTGAAGPTPTPSAGSGTNGACYTNCLAQLRPLNNPFTVDLSKPLTSVVALNSTGARVTWIDISVGSLRLAANQSSTNGRVSALISPVSDSVIRAAENRVASSRADVAASGFLTAVQTVVSPIFELTVDPAVAVPFASNITVTSFFDQIRAPLIYTDMCLAKLFQLPDVGYAAWRCLYITQDVGNNQKADVRMAVGDAPSQTLTGSVAEPGIFAFVVVPVAQPEPPSTLSWVREHALELFLVLAGALIFIFFVFYLAQRLWRYRAKYKDEAKEVQKQLEEVRDLEEFGGQAGTKDEEVTMMSNPLVVQMKDMQARLDATQMKLREEEAIQKQEATVVRHEHINALQEDRDKLAAELERLKSEIALTQSTPIGRPQAVAIGPTAVSSSVGLVPAGTVSSDSDYVAGTTTAGVPEETQQQARTEFQAVRPKKKKEEL